MEGILNKYRDHRGQTYTIDKMISSRNHSACNNRPGKTSAVSGLHNSRSRNPHDLFDLYSQLAFGFDISFRSCDCCIEDKNISRYVNCVGLTPPFVSDPTICF